MRRTGFAIAPVSANVAYSVSAPDQAICHCQTCHKTSGSTNSASALVPEGRFQLTAGDPKTFTKQHESGMALKLRFCGDCGSTLWKTGSMEPLQCLVIVEIGTLDDLAELDALPPEAELYTTYRAKWLPALPGATQNAETVETLGS
jgi:hypothetical protein